jgi:hypothetical protein
VPLPDVERILGHVVGVSGGSGHGAAGPEIVTHVAAGGAPDVVVVVVIEEAAHVVEPFVLGATVAGILEVQRHIGLGPVVVAVGAEEALEEGEGGRLRAAGGLVAVDGAGGVSVVVVEGRQHFVAAVAAAEPTSSESHCPPSP